VEEELLPGGNFGPVVRVGDTVRRETGPWTPAVHALLRHLEAVGFEGAPRVLGLDERGREILSFVEGEVPYDWPVPAYVWTDAAVYAIGALTRRYHDACAGFVAPPGSVWRTGAPASHTDEVVCHHDIAPWNVVFRNGLPVALIDWDFAGPGSRLNDLAYAAWRFAPLYAPQRMRDVAADPDAVSRRLRLLCDGYGLVERSGLLDAAVARMQAMHDLLVAGTDASAIRLVEGGHHLTALEDAAWVREHRATLAALL
jgi:hypothetical protein